MQGARCDAVRALLAVSNAAERRLWQSEITRIYWGLLGYCIVTAARFLRAVFIEKGIFAPDKCRVLRALRMLASVLIR